MKIAGIQKLTLIDYPEKVACTLFLHGCNFRCGFCHNPELVVKEPEKIYSKKEILDFLKQRKKYLDGVCITGGEPLMTLEEDFVRKIKSLGFLVKIDTNGSFPEKLQELVEKKLIDFVAMDVKISREEYSKVAGVEVDLNKIEKNLKLIINSNVDYELRTTIVEGIHTKENLIKMAKWINEIVEKRPKILILQKFKNSGKFIDGKFKKFDDTREDFVNELKFAVKDFFEEIQVR